MGKIIAIVNEKGGVGKTTTAQTLSYCLCRRGKKVLHIDYDGQAHSTLMCGIQKADEIPVTIYTLMNMVTLGEELPPLEEYIIHCENGIDLIPANSQMFMLERNLTLVDYREYILKRVITPLKQMYDYIIIDCMPQLGTPMVNAFVSADSIIIPTQAENLSAQGLTQLLRHFQRVKANSNPNLIVEGIVITMDSGRTVLSSQIKQILRTNYGEYVPIFDTCIPRSVKVAEAPAYFMNICEYEPTNAAALAYENLARELIAHG